jgi:hypothetical protein
MLGATPQARTGSPKLKTEYNDMKSLLSGVAIIAALAIAVPASAQGYGPGPGARTGTGPDVVPPGGYGPGESDLKNAPPGSFYPYPGAPVLGETTWSATTRPANAGDQPVLPQSR